MKFNVNANCGCCGEGGPFVCADICETLPASITVTIAGLESDFAWCGPTSDYGTCYDDFLTCIAGAADCTEECACAATRDSCYCTEVDNNSADKCVEFCPCASANGEWVLENSIEDPCTYVATFEFCEPVFPLWESGDPPLSCPSTDCSTFTIGAYLEAKGDGLVEIIFTPPFSHATVGWWTSGNVAQADICAGDVFPMDTAPTSGQTVYADEVQMGCGCGTDHSFVCGDIPWVCTQDPFTTCADTSQEVPCDFAQHNAVTVSDATVTP